jgi:serine/threonine protein kinase
MGCAASVHLSNSFVDSTDFMFSYCIGKGGFGKVYSCMHLASQDWLAIKEQKISEVLSHKNGLSLITAEVDALRAIGSHPFIIALHFAFYDSTSCYLGLDLCCGGDLRYHMNKKLHRFDEPQLAFLVMCMSSGLQHLHDHGVIHRDIKPENVMFNDRGYPLLTDFGVAYIAPGAGYQMSSSSDPKAASKGLSFVCNMSSGTKQYLAPEVFTSSHLHGPAADFWSLGVMLYELVFGKRPFPRHCPSNLIAFAENNYELSTAELQLPKGSTKLEPSLALSSSIVTVDCSDPSPSPLVSPHSSLPPSPLASPQGSSSLPPFLHTRIPRSNLLGEVSASCRSIISQLLDVRPASRHTHHTLCQEPWFEAHSLQWDEVERALIESPFKLNLKQISLDICTRFMFADEEEEPEAIAKHTLTSAVAAQLDSTLKQFQYVSPEYRRFLSPEQLKKLSLTQHQPDSKGEVSTAGDSKTRATIDTSGSPNKRTDSSPVVNFRHEIL